MSSGNLYEVEEYCDCCLEEKSRQVLVDTDVAPTFFCDYCAEHAIGPTLCPCTDIGGD